MTETASLNHFYREKNLKRSDIKTRVSIVEYRWSSSKPREIIVGRSQTEGCDQGEPRRYISGSRPVESRTAAAASLGSFALSTAAGARILYLKGYRGTRGGGKRAN